MIFPGIRFYSRWNRHNFLRWQNASSQDEVTESPCLISYYMYGTWRIPASDHFAALPLIWFVATKPRKVCDMYGDFFLWPHLHFPPNVRIVPINKNMIFCKNYRSLRHVTYVLPAPAHARGRGCHHHHHIADAWRSKNSEGGRKEHQPALAKGINGILLRTRAITRSYQTLPFVTTCSVSSIITPTR